MANLQRLLTRRPHIDEAELEDVRERTMARLAGLNPTSEPPVASEPIEAVVAAAPVVEAAIVAPEPLPVVEPVVVKTGPKIIVPRSIQLGPPEAAPVDVEAHRPAIIVTGDVEPEAVAAEVAAAPDVVAAEPEAVIDVVEPDVIALGPSSVAEPVVVEPESSRRSLRSSLRPSPRLSRPSLKRSPMSSRTSLKRSRFRVSPRRRR